MEKERLQEFAARVTQANRSELVVVIYEAALASIEEGKSCLEKNDIMAARKQIPRARGMVDELLHSLDLNYEISHYLRQLYIYVYRELCQGIALRDIARLDHASAVLKGLLPAFRGVAEQDDSGPVMENTQQIYAGLTYGRDSLNETVAVGVNYNRGFEA